MPHHISHDTLPVALHEITGKSINTLGKLNSLEEVRWKQQRQEGSLSSRAEFMINTFLSTGKRCLNHAWNRRAEKVNRNFAKRHRYLGERVSTLRDRIEVTSQHTARFDDSVVGDVSYQLLPDDDAMSGETAAEGGEQPPDGKNGATRNMSERQKSRLDLQAVASKRALQEERRREEAQLRFFEEAVAVTAQGSDATDAGIQEMNKGVKLAINMRP